ncbi:TPA_exp: Uncharacterized protein A8136_1143 [Trichophyton benhamiae CBS 112371]|uniref:Uncharacterized protein n=2 Tax=Trichophyton TaxID=5550 RepID=D4AVC1_ARTBC|nr:uncharacterized protein ARB_00130 [Trichophyton benhamiae CBS 112371]XP_003019327.1 uncharacterized protein TRV_06671 [Trichophyton verrucosum HKI 0517]EFE33043.1 hypothetical protein ARB_00130 [Trichophyton benhamiae CBS 112371]EFE38682.1 hypothetical protein TRV_06671 [Trichophyton verrucosum HKI 0517]DAA76106.1 TPA_exp: Uncharacterized protein A8136_1143 [Trichophyton benhamiae CBS 112371]
MVRREKAEEEEVDSVYNEVQYPSRRREESGYRGRKAGLSSRQGQDGECEVEVKVEVEVEEEVEEEEERDKNELDEDELVEVEVEVEVEGEEEVEEEDEEEEGIVVLARDRRVLLLKWEPATHPTKEQHRQVLLTG